MWELGLLTVASLVVQKIVTGASLTDPIVITGALVAGTLYLSATRRFLTVNMSEFAELNQKQLTFRDTEFIPLKNPYFALVLIYLVNHS